MYSGLATMMGTVWLRLSLAQENIQSFVNAIVDRAGHAHRDNLLTKQI